MLPIVLFSGTVGEVGVDVILSPCFSFAFGHFGQGKGDLLGVVEMRQKCECQGEGMNKGRIFGSRPIERLDVEFGHSF